MTRRDAIQALAPLVLGGIASRSGKATTVFGRVTVAAQWFVDAVAGSDANNGTSVDTPLQTIPALLGKTIVSGNLIALKCNSEFHGRLLIPAVNNVHVCSYGSGAAPILDCSVVISAGAWSKTGGQTNVYQISATVEATGSTWNRMWEDGTHLVRASSLANCDATAGTYYASSDSSTTPTLYVHATGSGNPASNGKAYENAKYYAGYDAVANAPTGCRVTGIHTKRNLANDGSLLIGKNGYAYRCTASEGSKHTVYVRTGGVCHTVIAADAYFGGQSFSLFVGNENSPDSEGLSFISCDATLSTYEANATGFYSHTNTSGTFGKLLFDTCTTNNCSIGISGNSATSGLVRNCAVTNANICYSADHDWLLTGCSGQANQGANPQVVFVGSTNVEITGFTGSTTGSHWVWIGANSSAYIHDCDWSAISGPIMISLRGANGSLTTRRLSFNSGSVPYIVTATASASFTLDCDYNTYMSFGAMGFIGQINNVYKTWAEWQALGYDAHSTES